MLIHTPRTKDTSVTPEESGIPAVLATGLLPPKYNVCGTVGIIIRTVPVQVGLC